MTSKEKCQELLNSFTEEHRAGVTDVLGVLAEDPTNELIAAPKDGFNVVQRARKVVLEGALPWEAGEELPTVSLIAAMTEVSRMEASPSAYVSYTDVDEMFKAMQLL